MYRLFHTGITSGAVMLLIGPSSSASQLRRACQDKVALVARYAATVRNVLERR
jgi:hypothetical protein